ncbi:DUF4138 domain-containing protein [Cellulophaga baltica]|uniref:DUF4138 domain-containing protein n=1 Tax=Cellulophaga baltica 18 TaxID=1348584 RepID=A0AAU8S4C4_9FLAO|nr:DUF4138 domain-containing protein [Cellulophaga baltica]AIZ42814.1 hypothetical protein M666_15265 [Cellulophaga baltica 18]
MKKNYFFLIVYLVLMGSVTAQDNAKPLTVEANEFTTVTLFFPAVIEQVIPPASNYKFEFDQGNTIGTLKARKGTPSNMTVITTDGSIFSIVLNYSQKLEKYTHIINANQAVGAMNSGNSATPTEPENTTIVQANPKPNAPPESVAPVASNTDPRETIKTPPTDMNVSPDVFEGFSNQPNTDPELYSDSENDLYNLDREEYYSIFCENNYLQKSILKRSFRQNKKIIVRLNNILVDREEIYFMLSLENTSKKDYNVNGLSFFIKESHRDNNPSILEPVHTFNLQKIIDPESNNEIVYVFKKFPLQTNQIVEIVLDEIDSSRMVILPLDYKYLNLLSK